MITILPIDTPGLGDRSYLAHDGEVALVVDPQRDYDRVLGLAEAAGVRITHVFESHIHNDYVTGGYELARAVGARYLLNADDPVSFERIGVRDGERGRGRTPDAGTRPAHPRPHPHPPVLRARGRRRAGCGLHRRLAALRLDRPAGPARPRPHRRRWPTPSGTRHTGWPPSCPTTTAVYPTHGFGSFCSATQSERHREHDRPGEARQPRTDHRRGPLRRGPPRRPGRLPRLLRAHGLRPTRQAPQRWICPCRRRPTRASCAVGSRPASGSSTCAAGTAFAAGHVAGTLNFGLDGQFVTYLGWLMPWGTPVTLLGETAEDVAEAQRELVRIGIDRPAAMATGKPEDWTGEQPLRSFPQATFARPVRARWRRPRRRSSSTCGATRSAPRSSSPARCTSRSTRSSPASTRSRPATVWVHCAGGYRAGVVAALLDARGFDVVAVDDSFAGARAVGLPMTTERA